MPYRLPDHRSWQTYRIPRKMWRIPVLATLWHEHLGSSAKSVDGFRLREVTERVVQGDF